MSLLDTLVRDISRQLAVLNDHDHRVDRRGMAGFVPADQLEERARNIAMALSQNYRIESIDEVDEPTEPCRVAVRREMTP